MQGDHGRDSGRNIKSPGHSDLGPGELPFNPKMPIMEHQLFYILPGVVIIKPLLAWLI